MGKKDFSGVLPFIEHGLSCKFNFEHNVPRLQFGIHVSIVISSKLWSSVPSLHSTIDSFVEAERLVREYLIGQSRSSKLHTNALCCSFQIIACEASRLSRGTIGAST